MNLLLNRVILFVQDVNALKHFYQSAFGLEVIEEIAGEWVVFKTGSAELALHRAGPMFRDGNGSVKAESNAKLVFETDTDIAQLRDALKNRNVAVGEVKSFGDGYFVCDGEDPEGNVFQLRKRI